jgi:hypothetical protein
MVQGTHNLPKFVTGDENGKFHVYYGYMSQEDCYEIDYPRRYVSQETVALYSYAYCSLVVGLAIIQTLTLRLLVLTLSLIGMARVGYVQGI